MPGEFAADFGHDTNAPTPGDEDEDELETSANLEGEGSGACVARRVDTRPVPSVASLEGPMLLRNPERAAADALESERHRRLNTTSDQLGGRDVRILRVNFEAIGGREPWIKSKRSAPESSASSCIRVYGVGDERAAALFREDADCRAEAKDKRRREESEERRSEEKQEREEREKVRRDEVKKEEIAREDRREQEAERRRQFEARLEEDRAEARLISTIQKNK
ncbi:hypothetical protein ON010_g13595 [Phytophthora cinnamomi]|nr:hypothetical protein ON010_g13595 [Phytophthora cinnamomi]